MIRTLFQYGYDIMSTQLSPVNLARMIDVSAVQAFNTAEDVRELARIAREHNFIAAHVLPHFVGLLHQELTGSQTLTGAPVGFPAGANSTRVKVEEARELVGAGVQEMDMMMNVGRLRSRDNDYVLADIRSVVEAVKPIPVKVILEVHYLSDDEIKRACELCIGAGAGFVKTGTGWAPSGATLERVQLITDFVRGAIKVKASGGIRDLETVKCLLQMGVRRFGINTNAAVSILTRCGGESMDDAHEKVELGSK
jgi:deoxyribose-phosphate aldolase